MIGKVLEVRDRCTCISVIAMAPIDEEPNSQHLLDRVGFKGSGRIILLRVDTLETHCTPYDWPDKRTMFEAHRYIEQHYTELKPGQVVDVEYVLGETTEAKKSEYQEQEESKELLMWHASIRNLAARPGVREIAVNNFLISLPKVDILNDLLNLQMDARLYKWNKQTIKAILEGISIAYKMTPKEFNQKLFELDIRF